jgi:hypothetical protein
MRGENSVLACPIHSYFIRDTQAGHGNEHENDEFIWLKTFSFMYVTYLLENEAFFCKVSFLNKRKSIILHLG